MVISLYHPASQGVSEIVNREVNKSLGIYTTQFAIHDWDLLLPAIQPCVNNTFNSSIGETPFYALFSYDSSSSSFTPPELSYAVEELAQHMQRTAQIRQHCRSHLLKAQTYYTDYTNNKRRPKDIKIGLRVYAKIDKHHQVPKNKLDLPVSEPFKVISQRRKSWKFQELSTNKNYIVHPDNTVLEPSVVISKKSKLTKSRRKLGRR